MTNEAPDLGALGPNDPRRDGHVVLVSRLRTGRVVEAMRYSDATLYDRMHARAQLSDRQHEAAERLARMWTAVGLNARVVAGIDVVRDTPVDEEPAHEQTDDDETAHDRYRRLMSSLSNAACMRLEAMLCEQHPGVRWLGSLQAALNDLADRWGIAK